MSVNFLNSTRRLGRRKESALTILSCLSLLAAFAFGWVNGKPSVLRTKKSQATATPVLATASTASAPIIVQPTTPAAPTNATSITVLPKGPMHAPTIARESQDFRGDSNWKRLASKIEVLSSDFAGKRKITPFQGGLELVLESDPIFKIGTAFPQKKSKINMRGLAEWLAKNASGLDVAIESHTDEAPVIRHRGEFASNWQLSAARAGALAMIFEESRFPLSRLRAIGLSASSPIGLDPRKNRRIVIRLSGSWDEPSSAPAQEGGG